MFEKGTLVYGYEILEPIGSGGLSQNYKARGSNGSLVTLKFPTPELVGDPATYERFLRELKIGKQLVHPAIPRTISIIEKHEGPCLVMEYIEGRSLRNILQEHLPLALEKSLDITSQLAEALVYLHSNGVYHRDLKPENVLIDSCGKVHIIDFGIALLRGARRVTWRNLSDVLGTPDYMAPEQIQGKRGDSRTDLYALGMMLYEMLTGAIPFHGDNALSIMHQQLTVTPPLPRQSNPAIPPHIEEIIMKSIRKNPNERYQSAEAFLSDLKNYDELDVSNLPRRKEKTTGVITNRQIWVLGGIIAFVFLAIFGLIIIIGLLRHH
jgi:eukaryotic-like serine/threonine-protein kinase